MTDIEQMLSLNEARGLELIEENKKLRAELKSTQEFLHQVADACQTAEAELLVLRAENAELVEAKQLSDHKSAAYVLGWNECRAAMIQATPKPGEKE